MVITVGCNKKYSTGKTMKSFLKRLNVLPCNDNHKPNDIILSVQYDSVFSDSDITLYVYIIYKIMGTRSHFSK